MEWEVLAAMFVVIGVAITVKQSLDKLSSRKKEPEK